MAQRVLQALFSGRLCSCRGHVDVAVTVAMLVLMLHNSIRCDTLLSTCLLTLVLYVCCHCAGTIKLSCSITTAAATPPTRRWATRCWVSRCGDLRPYHQPALWGPDTITSTLYPHVATMRTSGMDSSIVQLLTHPVPPLALLPPFTVLLLLMTVM